VTVASGARIALVVFVVAILQVSAFSSISILGALRTPPRHPVASAAAWRHRRRVAGFAAG
jgi:hypothetical protein